MNINGIKSQEWAGTLLSDYLDYHKIIEDRVVVEINGQIVKRSMYKLRKLILEDVVEIVQFVGGG